MVLCRTVECMHIHRRRVSHSDVNILNVPLGATDDYSQLGNVRYCVSFVGIISVILTVIYHVHPSVMIDDSIRTEPTIQK